MVTEQVLLPVRVGTTCGSFVHAREAHFMQLEKLLHVHAARVPGTRYLVPCIVPRCEAVGRGTRLRSM